MKYLILAFEERTFFEFDKREYVLSIILKKASDKGCTYEEALRYFEIHKRVRWIPFLRIKMRLKGGL